MTEGYLVTHHTHTQTHKWVLALNSARANLKRDRNLVIVIIFMETSQLQPHMHTHILYTHTVLA